MCAKDSIESQPYICAHCGMQFAQEPIIIEVKKGKKLFFCCRGCAMGYKAVHQD